MKGNNYDKKVTDFVLFILLLPLRLKIIEVNSLLGKTSLKMSKYHNIYIILFI